MSHMLQRAVVAERLANHFVKRLSHAARADAIEFAIAQELLVEVDRDEKRRGGGRDNERRWTTSVLGSDDDDDFAWASPPRGALELGPRLVGMSRARITTVLKRHGVELVTSTQVKPRTFQKKTAPHHNVPDQRKALIADIVRAFKNAAPPPCASRVATLLLVAEAFRLRSLKARVNLKALGHQQPIVSLVSPVKGFEALFLTLLKEGLVLPGTVSVCDGHDLRGSHDIRFSSGDATRWKTIIFRGSRYDKGEAEAEPGRRQVGIAAQSSLPILGISENPKTIPPALKAAASLDLQTGSLTADIVLRTMEVVLGEEPADLGRVADHCEQLSLYDLALAIRPGVSGEAAADVLAELAISRQADDGAHPPSQSDAKDESRSSWSGGSRRAADQGTGSEIVQPASRTHGNDNRFVATIETLSGYGEARDWALALKDDLVLWREGTLGWDDLSSKLLLSGPPGTGKTTFARALCNTLQVPLIATSVATWLELGYLGDVIKRMRRAFAEAAANAPAILFIDEIDGISKRSSNGRSHEDYWNSVVNRLLELLDGTLNSTGVIVVGAANNPSAIDPALLRSGRLEKHIVIPRPDIDALVGIFRHHLRDDLDHVIATRRDASPQGLPDHKGILDCAMSSHERATAMPDNSVGRL
ncbi:AAA family ATPase [Aquamicrobium zhengzhouense]|uniref:ATP-binding protein n=1 Tax=Aquamicrobium zhengzhouense TaxID=2781738 RepID=A0ABS0SH52_9HYPH|nr:ATP-binding protein [Aquamicrobium zhengzhouense]MBI1622634.1 ATP-binding protein [Aquamicrobium zhengzhouense]